MLSERTNRIAAPPFGLVLAGGQSLRMGQDKALLEYAGISLAHRAHQLLASLCEQVFLSRRVGQGPLPGLAPIFDQFESRGPMTGLLSAFKFRPDVAWFVLACDLPFMARPILEKLKAQRAPDSAGAVISLARGGIQPTCAIYEPQCFLPLEKAFQTGAYGLRAFIQSQNFINVPEENEGALTNVNTWEDYRRVLNGTLNGTSIRTSRRIEDGNK